MIPNASMDKITQDYVARHGDLCAVHFFRRWQVLFWIVVVDLLVYLFLYDPAIAIAIINFWLVSLFLASVGIMMLAIVASLLSKTDATKPVDPQREEEESWPLYTILVPLFRESNVAKNIVASMERLDYPKDKLDIKLLLEESDAETQDAVRRVVLPSYYETIVIPHAYPLTKPKACNHGLAVARGEFCVIYDAEDRPEPDQLKIAVRALRRGPSELVCVQAKLNFYNPRQNMLTKWFTIDYTVWFDFFLPGLAMLGGPIPLGGTSNHFRMSALRTLGGWDPFNVTEDCDLGIRIARNGWRTGLIDSTTWEEANPNLRNWINQRSRWIKGYFQTHILHLRHPVSLVRSIGWINTFLFCCTVGWRAATQALNVVVWLAMLLYGALLASDVLAGRNVWTVVAGHRNEYRHAWKILYIGAGENSNWVFLSVSFFAVACALVLVNFAVVAVGLFACRRRGYHDLWLAAVLFPCYWILISIGAWKGFIQLFTKRFYWEKTRHGLDTTSTETSDALPSLASLPTTGFENAYIDTRQEHHV